MKGQLRLTNGRRLKSPNGQLVRPTTLRVREALMNILRERIKDSNWLDLYSGSGIISCEVIERGAKNLLSIEFNRKAYEICRLNIQSTEKGMDTQIFINTINTEAIRLLKSGYKKYSTKTYQKLGKQTNRFDFVYIDPPYNHGDYFQALENLLEGEWVSNNCMAICEFSISNGINLPEGWQVKDQKQYGDTGLIFLTPSQALHYCDDIDSRHSQISLGS